jgi:hypothetical protein
MFRSDIYIYIYILCVILRPRTEKYVKVSVGLKCKLYLSLYRNWNMFSKFAIKFNENSFQISRFVTCAHTKKQTNIHKEANGGIYAQLFVRNAPKRHLFEL